MTIQTAMNTAVYGFQQAERSLLESAERVAGHVVEPQSSTQTANTASAQSKSTASNELIQMKVAQHQANANLKTIQTADQVLGTLIDVKV